MMKYEFKSSRIYDLENEMHRCELVFITRISKIYLFEGWAIGFLLISKAIKEEKSLFKAYTKTAHRKKIIESLETIKAFDNTKQYQLEIFEKSYLDLYQAFEYFILDCYLSIFCTYPKLIRFFNDKIKTAYNFDDKSFINENEGLVNDLIEETLRKISLTSINEQIETFQKIPINIKLSKKDLLQIMKFSKNRNLLVHNDGNISKAFIKKLEQQKINHDYEIGNYLTRDYLIKVPFSSYKYLLEKTVKLITNRITLSSKKLKDFNRDFN